MIKHTRLMNYLTKMKIPFYKPLLAATSAAILASCGSSAPAIVSTPIANIDTIPLKVTALTDAQFKNWPEADLIYDTIPGMSVDRAYSEIIKNQKGKKVIVAVIDSGTDIEHEDLKNVIWTNEDEIPGNGIDDDNNGYIDDVHGWNFLGDAVDENLEFVRIYKKLKPKYEGKSASDISEANRQEFILFKDAEAEYNKKLTEAQQNLAQYQQIKSQLVAAHQAVSSQLGKEDYTMDELKAMQATAQPLSQYKAMLLQIQQNVNENIPKAIEELDGALDYYSDQVKVNLNLDLNGREIVGDNPDDLNDRNYGNNNVMGPEADKKNIKHGTHVAGIIAAQRNNGIGMNGVAQNVEIMAVRAVPNGDEYDKDIALAIRYAVDNGAKVINTSFGKYFSTHPDWVRDAIKYAADHDVLIVNAAGNESLNLDEKMVYPNDQTPDNPVEISDNFLTVGALNYDYGAKLVANFSNYGKKNVDVFAPGNKIWSTTPNNEYEYLQGTSMASPEVAGIAAMIRSYFPKLTAPQVKKIIMDSGLPVQANVIVGGDRLNTQEFSELSTSGKIANLYNALILASKVSK